MKALLIVVDYLKKNEQINLGLVLKYTVFNQNCIMNFLII